MYFNLVNAFSSLMNNNVSYFNCSILFVTSECIRWPSDWPCAQALNGHGDGVDQNTGLKVVTPAGLKHLTKMCDWTWPHGITCSVYGAVGPV